MPNYASSNLAAIILQQPSVPELADLTIYVIDVAAGEKIPRKGGPGITRSDLLVINKIDLAPLVGANLAIMEADALRMRGKRPFVFTNLKSGEGVDQIASFVIEKGGPLDLRANAVTPCSISLASRTSTGLNSIPKLGATA